MPVLMSSGNRLFSVINFLPRQEWTGYSSSVAAKSATGRRNPCNLKATQHAPGVFFYVVALAYPYFMVWWQVVFFRFLCHIVRIMVVQAGQLSGWPVSFRAGIPTPVWATTHERRNSGGSVTRYLKEVAIMATVPVLSYPEFTFVFLAVRRSDYTARPCSMRVNALNEQDARLQLIVDFILSFAARIPAKSNREVVA